MHDRGPLIAIALHRLVYFSRNTVPGSRVDIAFEIESILASSRRNNMRGHITGALIFNSGVFAQVLEGSRDGIENTFERIQRDPRHSDVQILAFEPIERRVFPSWSMAFVGRSKPDHALFAYLASATGFDETGMIGDRLFEIIRTIAEEEEIVAA
ncbi:hypothetical protein BH10PSE7_BH10PSE7_35840 [soil metagenome]